MNYESTTIRSICLSIIALVLAIAGVASDKAPAQESGSVVDLLTREDIRGGLVLYAGSTDGTVESELAGSRAYLVHSLALDDARRDKARKSLHEKGLYGLATVTSWHDRGRLPYATNLATALIVDLDSLGENAPGKDELMRVLAPQGKLLIRDGEKWRLETKPRPAEMDDWNHFDHGADGNPVSADTLVTPVRQQQWITGVQPNPFEGNPAGYSPGAGIRISGRYAVLDVDNDYEAKEPRDRNTWVLQCRDAFNGVPLWTVPRDMEVAQRRWSLVAADNEVYAWLRRDGNLTALDIATGKPLREYAGTGWTENQLRDETACIRVAGKRLIIGLRDRIVCFDRHTARQQWEVAKREKLLLGHVVDDKSGRVYCLVAKPGARREFGGRWPHSQATESALAVNLATGAILWECSEIASRKVEREDKKPGRTYVRGPGQLVPAGDQLIVFGSCAISGGNSPYIATINANTGELQHQTDQPFQPNYNVYGYNVLWKDDDAWFAGAFTNVWRYQPKSGEVERVITNSWNQRCTRFTATPRYFMFGQSAYYDSDFAGEQVCVARSGCAMGNIPANGMTYFTPTACGCITQVRGFQAMSGEPLPPELDDEHRHVAGRSERPLPPMKNGKTPTGPVVDDWIKQWRAGTWETEPVEVGDRRLVAMVHQHELQCRRGDDVLWRFIADGRISSPPVVANQTVLFGAHDGWVYAVDLDDGQLRWKYLLAPSHRWMCVNSQLESNWPVYGVCLSRESPVEIIASAGTHVELAGGVVVAAFDARTGDVTWKKHLAKSPSVVPAGGRSAKIVGHSFINSVPRIEDQLIVLGDGGRKGGYFAFCPDEDEQAVNARLAAPEKPKK